MSLSPVPKYPRLASSEAVAWTIRSAALDFFGKPDSPTHGRRPGKHARASGQMKHAAGAGHQALAAVQPGRGEGHALAELVDPSMHLQPVADPRDPAEVQAQADGDHRLRRFAENAMA